MKNMIGKIGVILCILYSTFLFAQVDTAWVSRYNGPGNGTDYANAIAVDNMGNTYVTGVSDGNGSGSDYATIKYSPDGDTLWIQRYDGPANYTDEAYALVIDDAGNTYVTGKSAGSGTSYDYATIKYSPDGDTLWVRRYDGPAGSADEAYGLAVDSAGNVYVTGKSPGSGTGMDYATIKYNPDGDTLWVRRYDGPAGTAGDYGSAIAVDNAGNVCVTGYTFSFSTGFDYVTVKYNSEGVMLWAQTYNGSANSTDMPYAIATDDAGNVYVTGKSPGSGTLNDYATIKYSPDGDTLWVRRYNGPGNSGDYANAMTVDDDGNVYVTGESRGSGTGDDYATIKYSSDGDTLWVRRYNGPGNDDDYAYAIAVDSAGNVYVTGESSGSGTSYDYATIKYNPDGDALWIQRYDAQVANYDGGSAIAVDNAGNTYVTGYSYSTSYDYVTIKYVEPAFSVVPTSIAFGDVYVDSIKTDSVTVTNTGTGTLNIDSVVSDNAEFTVTPTTGSIAPAASMQFYITFAPTDPGPETGDIIFTHNAMTSPDTIVVTGSGIVDEEPNILSVTDILNDQGRWVRVTWAASLLDYVGSINPITQYGIWRRIDEYDKGNQERNSLIVTDIEDVLEGWDAVGTVPAIQDSIYNFVSPTLVDSNASGINYSVFIITAHTQNPELYYISEHDSGYSVDNIPPETPYNLAGEVIGSDVLLTWQIQLSYPDFSHFAVYRDTTSGFVPGDVNRIGTSEVSTYTDTSVVAGTYYYLVSALDVNGNESDYSNEVEVTVTGIKEIEFGIPAVYGLQNYPNPFKLKTGIHYQLPRSGVVTIAVYNVSGQRIKTLVNEHREAGFYTVHWDGRSEDNQWVSNGVYFCRMVAGEYVSVKKILLTR
ncbi:hypothetical protein ES705_24816 [subsurface metagenome]